MLRLPRVLSSVVARPLGAPALGLTASAPLFSLASRFPSVVSSVSSVSSSPVNAALFASSAKPKQEQTAPVRASNRTSLVDILKRERSEEQSFDRPALPTGFEIVTDNPKESLVEIKRTFESEEITVRFNVPPPPDSLPEEEEEYFDEYMNSEADKQDPESKELAENQEQAEDTERGPYDSLQHFMTVLIHKPKVNQTLSFECVAMEGVLYVNGVVFFEDGQLPFRHDPKSDFERDMVYQGPKYDDLNGDLLVQLNDYLTQRGVNDDLAQFVHEYISYKEQNCYMGLLDNMVKFMQAK